MATIGTVLHGDKDSVVCFLEIMNLNAGTYTLQIQGNRANRNLAGFVVWDTCMLFRKTHINHPCKKCIVIICSFTVTTSDIELDPRTGMYSHVKSNCTHCGR